MSLHAPDGYDCPFCRIAGGHLPKRVVLRTDEVMVLVNIKWWPKNPGGCLVVPVEHVENLYEIAPRLGTPILEATQQIALALKEARRCDGVSTRQHNEPAGNQDVWHYHQHVFPRWEGDGLYGSHGSIVDMADVERMAGVLRGHVAPEPKAAAAVIRDAADRILVVEPTYRETWGLPGGGVEHGERPRDGCAREIREELGLELDPGPLLAVDHRRNDAGVWSYRFLYDAGVIHAAIDDIVLPADELRSFRFVDPGEAVALLEPALGQRLQSALDHERADGQPIYLENGALPS